MPVKSGSALLLEKIATNNNLDIFGEEFCEYLDAKDCIAHLRDEFFLPDPTTDPGVEANTEECIYFSGCSLGLQPKSTCIEVAKVVVMNDLNVNLHLLLVSFYRPTKVRNKVLLVPSENGIVQSQIKQRGFNPKESMLFLGSTAENYGLIEMEEYCDIIEKHGKEIALVLLPGMLCYTGQALDIQMMTKIAHSKGCMVGFDLSHAVGNIELHIHDWGLDFAAWSTEKYLNSGPGCMAGAFVHQNHKLNDFPKFHGWWSHKESTRFRMTNILDPEPGVKGYRISHPTPLLVACIKASLTVFQKTTMKKLREKSVLLTGYLEHLLLHYIRKPDKNKIFLEILTPPLQRGCQLSLKFNVSVSEIHNRLAVHGASCDLQEPDVIRVSPVPLYNNFKEVFRYVKILRKIVTLMTHDN